jgi:hypothetical protein
MKADNRRFRVKYCESCKDWEPIPFHGEGGVCMGRRVGERQQLTPDFIRRAAKDIRATAKVR